jgi:large subunit ribosomal protein L10
MNRDEKKLAVAEIEQIYNGNSAIFVTHYHGLTVSQLNELRKDLRQLNAGFKVIKNTLAKIAAKNIGINNVDTLFAGPVGVVFSDDPVSAAKSLTKFAKKNQALKIMGGIMDRNLVDDATVHTLSKLPSMDELRGTIIGILQAPATNIARVTSAPAAQLARVIDAYSKK